MAISRTGVYYGRRLALNRWGIFYQTHRGDTPHLVTAVSKKPSLSMSVSADDRDMLLQVSVEEGADLLISDIVHW